MGIGRAMQMMERLQWLYSNVHTRVRDVFPSFSLIQVDCVETPGLYTMIFIYGVRCEALQY